MSRQPLQVEISRYLLTGFPLRSRVMRVIRCLEIRWSTVTRAAVAGLQTHLAVRIITYSHIIYNNIFNFGYFANFVKYVRIYMYRHLNRSCA